MNALMTTLAPDMLMDFRLEKAREVAGMDNYKMGRSKNHPAQANKSSHKKGNRAPAG